MIGDPTYADAILEQGWVKRVSDRVQLTEEGYRICK
jgi:hypothetical protein